MNILIDENIPLAKEIFSTIGNVTTISGRAVTNDILQHTDVLIVRSITKVNEQLLKKTPVRFVGTATAGIDHIDTDYLQKQNIFFTNAHGSNAVSVAEYIFYLIYKYAAEKKIHLQNTSLGIIGTGAVGGLLADKAEQLGIRVLRNDPPLENSGIKNSWYKLEELYQCGILTLHTPLTETGRYKTRYLFHKENLQKLNPDIFFINAARGAVVNNADLLDMLKNKKLSTVSLDVWENEPNINTELLSYLYTGTPHIAGYSYDGKVRGTEMIFSALCKYYNIKTDLNIENLKIPVRNPLITLSDEGLSLEETVFSVIRRVYDFERDFQRFTKIASLQPEEQGPYFDKLRKEYPIRREFSNYKIKLEQADTVLKQQLKILGFQIKGKS